MSNILLTNKYMYIYVYVPECFGVRVTGKTGRAQIEISSYNVATYTHNILMWF